MSPEAVFTIANNGILIFWLLLIVAPRWRGTDLLVHSLAVPVIIGLTYTWLIVRAFTGEGAPGASFSSLAGVMAFFTSPVAATAGWIHYLVFDLFIGAWQSRDAQRRAPLDRTDDRPMRRAALAQVEILLMEEADDEFEQRLASALR